jgi:hypothetical protein
MRVGGPGGCPFSFLNLQPSGDVIEKRHNFGALQQYFC